MKSIIAGVVALCAGARLFASTVLVEPSTFNPSAGERVTITVRTPPASHVSAMVLDRDGYPTRTLVTDASAEGKYVITWDGRDSAGSVVADEAYSFKIDVRSATEQWTYFPAANPRKTFAVQAKHYDRRNAALLYDLPAAARVHAQAGSAELNEKTKTYHGPVLKTLVNREPRPAGAVVESWSGFDESRQIYVPDLPHFVTAILATELPENAVIAFGNRSRDFLTVAASRSASSLLPKHDAAEAEHHSGLETLEDISPQLSVETVNGYWDEGRRSWLVGEAPARLRLKLKGPTAATVARQTARVVVFVDYVQHSEIAVKPGSDVMTIPLPRLPAGSHVVSINWQSTRGPLAANSVRIAGPAAAEHRRTAEKRNAGE
jgi:hypothetical protein